jgi:hypothetical protein
MNNTVSNNIERLNASKNLMGTRLRGEDESHDSNCPYRNHGECLCKYAASEKGKHTPGPWALSETASRVILGKASHGRMAVCVMQNTQSEHYEANCQLIAAAPDLLEALIAIESCLAPDDNDYAARKVREAIAKAEGREG